MDKQLSKTLKDLKETKELLVFFDAKLCAFDPGVVAYLSNNPNASTLDFSAIKGNG